MKGDFHWGANHQKYERNLEPIDLLQTERSEIGAVEYLSKAASQGDAGGLAARGHTTGKRAGGGTGSEME
jgi:hypothetical protein